MSTVVFFLCMAINKNTRDAGDAVAIHAIHAAVGVFIIMFPFLKLKSWNNMMHLRLSLTYVY